MTSHKKILVNQENSARSTGPKTTVGKEQSRRNATKHGIFTRELLVSDKDKPEFETLRSSLCDQLRPASAMQQIGFDKIVSSCWRHKLATRLEMKRLEAHLESKEDQSLQKSFGDAPAQNILAKWYGASNADLRKGIRILMDLGEEVSANGWIHKEDWKHVLTNTFGAECFELFTSWDPMSIDAILMTEHLLAHAKRFDRPLPSEPDMDSKKQRFTVDPKLSWQMSAKLIDLTRLHLEELARINRLGRDIPDERQGAPALDLGARYATTSTRELERAVVWYQYLKEQHL